MDLGSLKNWAKNEKNAAYTVNLLSLSSPAEHSNVIYEVERFIANVWKYMTNCEGGNVTYLLLHFSS